MNAEYERIKEIRIKQGTTLDGKPKMLSLTEENSVYKQICNNYIDFMSACKQENLEDEIVNLIKNIYVILSAFVDMEVYPEPFIQTLVNSNLQKIWFDGKVHYDDLGEIVVPPSWHHPFKELRKNLMIMQGNGYIVDKTDANDTYEQILIVRKKFHLPCSPILRAIDISEIEEYKCKVHNSLFNLINSDDLLDEIYALTSILYYTMEEFVKMGLNPSNILSTYIDQQDNNVITR